MELHGTDGIAGDCRGRLDAVRRDRGGILVEPGPLAVQGKQVIQAGRGVHPSRLDPIGAGIGLELHARDGVFLQDFPDGRQASDSFSRTDRVQAAARTPVGLKPSLSQAVTASSLLREYSRISSSIS